jgi:single-stranded DNA-binding protein
MIESLVSGKLFRDVELKQSVKNTPYCNFMLSVAVGEPKPVLISGLAFSAQAEKIAKLKKGDALTVIGSIKPNQWPDKTSGEIKHGLTMTVQDCLSLYDLKKRRNEN